MAAKFKPARHVALKRLAEVDDMKATGWTVFVNHDDTRHRPMVRCGDCHILLSLDVNHKINEAGVVTPSIGCPICGWHVWARLEGWSTRHETRLPRRLQRKRSKGWRMPDGAIYVGRPSKWGNPFRVENVGGQIFRVTGPHSFRSKWLGRLPAMRLAVDRYRKWLARYSPPHGALELKELRGHDLVCWCRLCDRHAEGKPLGETCPDCQPCHSDPLLELANQ